MKTNNTQPFKTFAIEKRLALGLAMQPQPNRKRERQTPILYDAAIMLTAFAIVGGALLILIKQPN